MNDLTISSQSLFSKSQASGAVTPELDKQAFLKLLVTQMRFQDPLNPVQNEAFVSQLAEFSSLESLNSINQEMTTANLLSQSSHNALATALIGKYTLTSGDTVELAGDSLGQAVYMMPEGGDVEIHIVDKDGNTVRTMFQDDVSAGEHRVDWDGTDDAGEKVPDGEYTIEVENTSATDAETTLSVFRVGRVRAVKFLSGSPILVIDGDEHRMSEIIEIMESLPEV